MDKFCLAVLANLSFLQLPSCFKTIDKLSSWAELMPWKTVAKTAQNPNTGALCRVWAQSNRKKKNVVKLKALLQERTAAPEPKHGQSRKRKLFGTICKLFGTI
eukprot:788595-Amphidinium_carterae.2